MFEIVWSLIMDFIGMVGWYLPMVILAGFLGTITFGGKK